MSVPTHGLSDMLDALTGRNQDDENKSKIHVTDEVQMHRHAASSAGSSSSLCLPGLPSASVATNFAQDQQNTWKMLMDMQQQMISFQTGLMRALEDCYGCGNSSQECSGRSSRIWKDRQDRLNPHRCQTSDLARAQTGSIQSKSCTTRRSSTLKNKPCSIERNVTQACEDTEGD